MVLFRKNKEISGHAAAIYTCAIEDKYIYSGSSDRFVARWLIEEGIQDKFSIKFNFPVYTLITAKELLFVGLSDGSLYVFDCESRLEIKFFKQHTKAIFSIAYNSEKDQLYVGDADGNLSIWNVSELKLLVYLPLDCGKIRDIAVDISGERFGLACQDDTIRIFESFYFNEITTIKAHKNGATALLFHPFNENELFSGGKDALIKQWDIRNSVELKQIPAHNFAIYSLILLNDGEVIASGSRDKTIKIWSLSDLKFLQRLDFKEGGHRHSVNKLAVIDKNKFVSCSDDKRIIVWESIHSIS